MSVHCQCHCGKAEKWSAATRSLLRHVLQAYILKSREKVLYKSTFTLPYRFGELRGNVCCSSWARWKVRSKLPINDNWTFFARCYSWGTTSENRL